MSEKRIPPFQSENVHNKHFINSFKKIKRLRVWNFLIEHIIYNFYNLIWTNIINLEARLLYFTWKKNQNLLTDSKNNVIISDNINFKNIASEINKESLPLIDDLKKQILSKEYSNQEFKMNKTFGKKPYSINFFDSLSDDLKEKIVKFASSNEMVSTAANHMKIFPILTRIQVNLNIPRDDIEPRAAMLWHKDLLGFKNLDFFMAISEIDESNGPFIFLKKKDSSRVLKSFRHNKEISGERGKIDLNRFKIVFPDEESIALKGDPGTALFIDTFSTFHRGGHCKNKNRITLRICYQSHDAIYEKQFNENKEYKFCQKIKFFGNLKKHEKFLFFKSKSNFMKIYSKFILKIFSIIEFKYD